MTVRHVVCVTLPFVLCLARAQEPVRLRWQDVQKGVSWQGNVPSARFAPDGVHYEVLSGKVARWFDPATGKEVEREAPAASAAGETMTPFARVFDNDLWLDRMPGGPGQGPLRRGNGRQREPGKDARRLTTDGATAKPRTEPHLSPDGKAVSFVGGNDLFVLDTAGGEAWQVTQDGGPELFHGVLDWVYQEEIYGRGDFQGHWWSPGSDKVAFLSLDESKVREFTVVNHVPDGFLDRERTVQTEVTNYPKPGDPNPTARMAIAHRDGRRVVPVDLSAFPADVLVSRVGWTPDGAAVLLLLQDRIQTWAVLAACDPATGAVTPWIREESQSWIKRPLLPQWLADGTFLWLSERTGYQHVYRYERGGKAIGAVTAGEWQVRRVVGVDEPAGRLVFEGTQDGATGRHFYRIGLDGTGLVGVTPGAGTHTAEWNAAGTFLIDRWTSLEHPTVVCLRDGNTGAVVKEIGRADKGDGEHRFVFCPWRRTTIRARDGYELDAAVMLPPDWQPGGRHPVFLPTYSGPDAPSVRDDWSISTEHEFYAQQGFVVLQVNVRSASNRGQVHAAACYRQLGVQELKDLEDAVDHVCAEFGGDPARVAIAGWSYGGFMAAFALTHSTKFALGLAGAGVYDWRLYDTVYTERYMRTPQENAAGYDATSVIKAAKDLHGHLVLLHGTMDDNVHMQNTMQLVWELQKAGEQDFELMLYPRSRHGLNGEVAAHAKDFQWLRLQKLLAPEKKGS